MIAQINTNYIKTRPAKFISRLLSYGLFEGRPLTTKGQWINPLVLLQYRFIKKLPQFKKVEKPIFIVGTGRSGTTILGVLLSMHRDVGFLNEPKALWHSIYPHEDLIGSYSRGPATYHLTSEDASPDVIKAAHKLYGAYLTAVCSKRVVDKYPELIFRIPFVKKIFPDAKFVFLVRNGWDTCYSIKKWSKRLGVRQEDETHDWWGVNNRKWDLLVDQIISPDKRLHKLLDSVKQEKDHINMAMMEWIATMREGIAQMQRYHESMIMVKFEDLTNNTGKTLSGILDFCELPKDSKLFQYAEHVISPVKPHPKLKIHPAIQELVDQTTSELGY